MANDASGWSWDDLLAYRSQTIERGEIPHLEELLIRCVVAPDEEQLWQLVSDELRTRRAAGEAIDPADYEHRFPVLSQRLASYFASGVETVEQLDQVLASIRELVLPHIVQGKKVVVS